MQETVLEGEGGDEGRARREGTPGMREGCSSSPSRGKRVERGWRGNDGKVGGRRTAAGVWKGFRFTQVY